jgi:uncharacterized protein YbaR (Trm112 family)
MMDISCEVVRDLLPLYHDGVCSDDSRALVEEHLKGCPACQAELETFDNAPKEKNMEEAKLIAGTAKAWKKNKAAAFFKGAMIVAVLACVACGVAYNVIGSYVAADGTLVEPFGFIPLAWLFAFLGVIFAVCFAVTRRRANK